MNGVSIRLNVLVMLINDQRGLLNLGISVISVCFILIHQEKIECLKDTGDICINQRSRKIYISMHQRCRQAQVYIRDVERHGYTFAMQRHWYALVKQKDLGIHQKCTETLAKQIGIYKCKYSNVERHSVHQRCREAQVYISIAE